MRNKKSTLFRTIQYDFLQYIHNSAAAYSSCPPYKVSWTLQDNTLNRTRNAAELNVDEVRVGTQSAQSAAVRTNQQILAHVATSTTVTQSRHDVADARRAVRPATFGGQRRRFAVADMCRNDAHRLTHGTRVYREELTSRIGEATTTKSPRLCIHAYNKTHLHDAVYLSFWI